MVEEVKTAKRYVLNLVYMGFLHFTADFIGHYYAFYMIPGRYTVKLFELFLLYNFIAFVLQCPIGYLFDRMNTRVYRPIGICAGMFFLYGGYKLGIAADLVIPGLVLCALGNAAIHVTGSRAVLEKGKRGLAGGGIFIAFGALGVGLGDYLGVNYDGRIMPYVIGVMVLTALVPAVTELGKVKGERLPTVVFDTELGRNDCICLVACLLAVFVRSYVGFIIPNGFKELINVHEAVGTGLLPAMVSSLAGFFGKASGGLLVILFMSVFRVKDLRKTNYIYGISALLGGAALYLACGTDPVASLIVNLLFHSVMPVTLYEIYRILPKNPGFSLGLTTLMLFAGMLPALMFSPSAETRTVLVVVFNCLAALCLVLGAVSYGRSKSRCNDGRKT